MVSTAYPQRKQEEDDMFYLAGQIAWLLVLSLVIGIAVGWFAAHRARQAEETS